LHKHHASSCIHSFKYESHTLFLTKGSICLRRWPDVQRQLAPTTLVQTKNIKVYQFEQEIHELREEVTEGEKNHKKGG